MQVVSGLLLFSAWRIMGAHWFKQPISLALSSPLALLSPHHCQLFLFMVSLYCCFWPYYKTSPSSWHPHFVENCETSLSRAASPLIISADRREMWLLSDFPPAADLQLFLNTITGEVAQEQHLQMYVGLQEEGEAKLYCAPGNLSVRGDFQGDPGHN